LARKLTVKVTKTQLRKIIKEELLSESSRLSEESNRTLQQIEGLWEKMDARDFITNVIKSAPHGKQPVAAIFAAAAFMKAGKNADARAIIAEDFYHLWRPEPDTLKAILDFIDSGN